MAMPTARPKYEPLYGSPEKPYIRPSPNMSSRAMASSSEGRYIPASRQLLAGKLESYYYFVETYAHITNTTCALSEPYHTSHITLFLLCYLLCHIVIPPAALRPPPITISCIGLLGRAILV